MNLFKKITIVTLVFACIFFLFKIFLTPKIQNTFPFSKSTQVELIFYKTAKQGGTDLQNFNNIQVLKKEILNDEETEKIFKILHKNYCFVEFSAACFNPREALLFKKQNDTIGLIEICFECSRIESSEGIENFKMCDERSNKLAKFINLKR